MEATRKNLIIWLLLRFTVLIDGTSTSLADDKSFKISDGQISAKDVSQILSVVESVQQYPVTPAQNGVYDKKNDSNYSATADCGSACWINEACVMMEDKPTCVCREMYAKNNVTGECELCYCEEGTKSCEFDIHGFKICTCHDKFVLSYSRDECRPCDCGSHGNCSSEGNRKTCNCEQGYSWNRDKGSKCLPCDCGEFGRCDFLYGKRSCNCNTGYAWEKEQEDKCLPCDCGEFGRCDFLRGERSCNCNTGYAWEKVQEDKCLPCDCGVNGVCYFENLEQRCRCKKGYELNTYKEHKCRECDCGPKGTCKYIMGNKFCSCEEGYSLLNPELCKECQCGNNSKACSFRDEKKVCSCNSGYQDVDGTCKECEDECVDTNSECTAVGGEPKCVCREGFVPDPNQQDKLVCLECDCGENSLMCSFNLDRIKKCECKDGYVYDEIVTHKCTADCNSTCWINEVCTMVEDQPTCVCRNNYQKIAGECELCYCGEGTVSCRLHYPGYRYCECQEKFAYDMLSRKCKPCDCGPNGRCSITGPMKDCHCDRGYSWDRGKDSLCLPCDCGRHGRCSFVDGVKSCECYGGYRWDKVVEDKCLPCDCGRNGRCSYPNGKKTCQCLHGYVLYTHKEIIQCRACNCGSGGNCTYVMGNKVCTCETGFSLFNPEKCKECQCGPNSTECFFKDEEKVCTCNYGYRDVDGTCEVSSTDEDSEYTTAITPNRDAVCSDMCGINEVCIVVEGKPTCVCREKYLRDNKTGECKLCYCGKETKSCKFDDQGRRVCTCLDKFEFESHFSRRCLPCDCGDFGSCSISYGGKACSCEEGYRMSIHSGGICVPCDCGEFAFSCDLHLGKKFCFCERGYEWENSKEGKCTHCDCGNGGRCYFENGEKRCQCDKYHQLNTYKEYRCRPCNCGPGGSCKYVMGNSVCSCNPGFSLLNPQRCKACNCGPFGNCSFEDGEKICECKNGYVWERSENNRCIPCDCGAFGNCSLIGNEKMCECEKGFVWERSVNKECLECDCGGNDHVCSFNSEGVKICQCDEGYVYDAISTQKCIHH